MRSPARRQTSSRRSRGKPFFLYLAFNAVHAPLEATAAYERRFPDITDSTRRTYAGMLSAMDDAVGRVLAQVRKIGPEENTLIFFYSDNGGPRRRPARATIRCAATKPRCGRAASACRSWCNGKARCRPVTCIARW